MKIRKFLYAFIFLSCAIAFIFPTSFISANANSALKEWRGVDGVGAIVTDNDVPIEVEKEILTFDLQDLPENGHELSNSLKVTAEYHFYNPSDYDITATLVFPYGIYENYENLSNSMYGVKINGERITSTKRHTYFGNSEFNSQVDVAKLKDNYISDAFYHPDLNVSIYTYKINLDAAKSALKMTFNGSVKKTKIFLSRSSYNSSNNSYSITTGTWVNNNDVVSLYVVGEDRNTISHDFRENFGDEAKQIQGSLTLQSKQTTTFKELVDSMYHSFYDVNSLDWYNAYVAMLNDGHSITDDLSSNLLAWYEYQITMAPGERIVNTVIAPSIPTFNERYEPSTYKFTYLLSPAKSWADFGELTININTSAYLIDNNLENFEKVDSGYHLVLNGLPDGELIFILSSDENPKVPLNWSTVLFYLIIILPIVLVIAIIVIIIVVIVKVRKKKKAKKNLKKS
ncbi:MAG: hypothetical protein IJ033_05660 [Clostridia bacterium]|nr:hypothetical protein [Clostridia bacterium]